MTEPLFGESERGGKIMIFQCNGSLYQAKKATWTEIVELLFELEERGIRVPNEAFEA